MVFGTVDTDLGDGLVDVVVFGAERSGHDGVLQIEGGYVGEFEDLDVVEVAAEGFEEAVGYPTVLEDEAVGVGEDEALDLVEAVGGGPVGDRGDLLLGGAEPPEGFAVLGVDEAAAGEIASAGLAEFAQKRVEAAFG